MTTLQQPVSRVKALRDKCQKTMSQPSAKRELKAQLRDAGFSVEMLERLALYLWRSGISEKCMRALPCDEGIPGPGGREREPHRARTNVAKYLIKEIGSVQAQIAKRVDLPEGPPPFYLDENYRREYEWFFERNYEPILTIEVVRGRDDSAWGSQKRHGVSRVLFWTDWIKPDHPIENVSLTSLQMHPDSWGDDWEKRHDLLLMYNPFAVKTSSSNSAILSIPCPPSAPKGYWLNGTYFRFGK